MSICHTESGLSLGERDYYLEADSATVGIRKAYRDYIQRLFELTGDDTATASGKADAVLRLETAIARPSYSATQRRDTEANYHKMAYADLKADYPAIDWDTYFNLLGFPAFTEVCVSQPEPIQAVGTLWTDTPIDDLKTYTSFKLINSAAGALSDDFRKTSFDFYGRTLSGRQQESPAWKRAVSGVEPRPLKVDMSNAMMK